MICRQGRGCRILAHGLPSLMDSEKAYASQGGTMAENECSGVQSGEDIDAISMPPEVLFYVIPYMTLRDILNMERVCKYLRHWIRSNGLLWRSLHIEPPLSKRIRDENLIKLFKRANGQLNRLILVNCMMITEDLIDQIVVSSPRLYKICIPGCTRVSAGSIVRMLTERNNKGLPPLKVLKLNNISGLRREHLESLLSMMGDSPTTFKPQYYHQAHRVSSSSSSSSYDDGADAAADDDYDDDDDDDQAIDVEVCPKCSDVGLVYDCTRERCQNKRECRGCIRCLRRCAGCGICIEEGDCEETLCHDEVCLSCWLKLPKCGECNRPRFGRRAEGLLGTVFVCEECSDSSRGETGVEFDL